MWEPLLTALFVGVELISIYAYWPQIKRLLEKGARAEGFAIKTWGLWSLAGTIGSFYMIFLNGDPYLIFLCVADTLGMYAILALALRYRLRYVQLRRQRWALVHRLANQFGSIRQPKPVWQEVIE